MGEPAPEVEDRCLDPGEVMVGTANGPGIYAGTPGAQVPAVDEETWPAPWVCLGYLSSDGPTVGQSTDSSDITPWQSVVPIRSVLTSRAVTVQFTMWQLSPITLAIYFDVDVPEPEEDGAMDFDIRTDSPQHLWSIGIDARDGERILRLGFYRASLSAAGDMNIQRGEAIGLDVTLSALDDGGRLANIKISGGTGVEPMAADLSRAQYAQAMGAQQASGGRAPGSRPNATAQAADLSSSARDKRAAEQAREPVGAGAK